MFKRVGRNEYALPNATRPVARQRPATLSSRGHKQPVRNSHEETSRPAVLKHDGGPCHFDLLDCELRLSAEAKRARDKSIGCLMLEFGTPAGFEGDPTP